MSGLTVEERQRIRELIHEEKLRRLALSSLGEKRCSGCGGEHVSYTRDCHTCTERRLGRNKRGPVVTQIRDGHCAGCQRPHDAFTPGCRQCAYRESKRRARQAVTPST